MLTDYIYDFPMIPNVKGWCFGNFVFVLSKKMAIISTGTFHEKDIKCIKLFKNVVGMFYIRVLKIF